jgi:hypothetical protein
MVAAMEAAQNMPLPEKPARLDLFNENAHNLPDIDWDDEEE